MARRGSQIDGLISLVGWLISFSEKLGSNSQHCNNTMTSRDAFAFLLGLTFLQKVETFSLSIANLLSTPNPC